MTNHPNRSKQPQPTHTPGPWAVGSTSGGYATSVCSATETFWDQSAGGKVPVMIAQMPARDANNYAEMDANARLIVAAPDLLAALKALCDVENMPDRLRAKAVARVVIAKAEGR